MNAKKAKTKHKHDYKIVYKDVLIANYKPEDGEMKYIGTTGKDKLKMFACKCGDEITIDLERVKA